jgi:TonB-linked SusC/RagA family outer membrane protein
MQTIVSNPLPIKTKYELGMKKTLRSYFLVLPMMMLSLFAMQANAQIVIKGTVLSGDDGLPLPSVSIQEKGTDNGTITDAQGNYQLTVNDNKAVLVCSFVGFVSQEVTVGNQSIVNITLSLNVSQLEEVVVIGYGTQSQRNLTSSISTIKSDEITKVPTSSAMQALQGKVAGVQIVSSGAPGAGPTVRIRGVGTLEGGSSPLYVVDGMFFSNIDFLNPSDIATISVLKDASAAAIYGSRAANGVVLIETNSGSYNQKAEIIYDGYYGVQVAQNVLQMANSQQFTDYALATGSSADAAFIDNAFQRFGRSRINPNVPNVNTDWYREVMQTSAPIQNHSLTINGGSENARYSVGASYFKQDGLLKETRNDYERFNLRSKIDFNASERFRVGGSVNVSNGRQYVAENSVWFKTYFAVPILPKYDDLNTDASPLGLSNAQVLGYRGSQNPFYDLNYNDNKNNTTTVLANFYLEYDLVPDMLTIRTSYNSNFGSTSSRNVNFAFNDGVTNNLSSLSRSFGTSYNQISDSYLTFTQDYGLHNITAVAGYSFRSETGEGLNALGTELDPAPSRLFEELWYLSRANNINEDAVGDFGYKNYVSSYFTRLAYSYNDRYLLYSTFRKDGTNKFQQKWGSFFTIGGGWIVSEEDFFDFSAVNFLKIRGGWGQLGNDAVTAAIGVPTVSQVFLPIDGVRESGNVVNNIYDRIEKWESSEQTNIGISSKLFNSRLSIEADYYVKETKDAAVTVLFPLVRANARRSVAGIKNSGFEVQMDWSDELPSGLRYNIGGNFTTLKNEVLGLGGPQYLDAGSAEFRQRSIIGQPLYAFFGYETEGVFQNQAEITNSGYSAEFIAATGLVPGDFKFKDQNHDGVIDDKDRVVLGSYLPKLTYGFNLGMSYKNFDLSANFQGQQGHSILNRKRGEIIFTTDTNIDAELANNLWTGEGTSNKYPSAAGLRKGWNQNLSDYFVEDGSYFRIQNIRLSYNIVGKTVLGTAMPETRITFTAEKPLTIFNYNGFTPEVSSGVDRQTYPIPAVYTMGLNIKF